MSGSGDYISREAAIAAVDNYSHVYFPRNKRKLEEIPAADVRPVVLCRACEMASPCSDDREVYCTLNHCYKKKSYFCADGREKNENSN